MNNMEAALAALQAKRNAGEPLAIDPLQKSVMLSKSLASAIRAMCWECVGRGGDVNPRSEVAHCTAFACPLWHLRPWQKQAVKGYGVSDRAEVIHDSSDTGNQGRAVAAALANPESRRKAINAKCYECTCGSRQGIRHCQSVFPRDAFGLDETTGSRGCPLWPHRPIKPLTTDA